MNEMKPEDVMRMLETINDVGDCSRDCLFYDGKVHSCSGTIARYALALLREKDALNAELTQTNAEKDAEIRVKKKLLDKCEERFAEKDAEIERMRGIFAELEEVRLEYLEGKYTEADMVVQLYLIRKKYEEGRIC